MTGDGKDHLDRGYIQIYTGNGKGKTTAALGLAFRAMGNGLKTYFGQFIKGQKYGEIVAARNSNSMITLEQYGRETFLHVSKNPSTKDKKMAYDGLSRARTAMLSGNYDIIVLDEVITSLHFNLLTVDDLLRFIEDKPANVELVLTGRYAPQELIEVADLVSEMSEVKHYYKKGISARDGIER
jgi:cob(I)alamin adenosyltransferase